MFKRSLAVAASLFALAASTPAHAQEQKPIKVGIVTFLSGAAAGPFGIPARNAAELFAAEANAGKLPAPYVAKGIGGRAVELVVIDEAGVPQSKNSVTFLSSSATGAIARQSPDEM